MSFVRRGPRYLFFKVKEAESFYQKLAQKTKIKRLDFKTAIKLAAEESVIVFLSNYDKQSFKVEDSDFILYLPLNSTELMAVILNDQLLSQAVTKVEAGPGQLVMRIPKNGKNMIKEIRKNYQAEASSILNAVDQGSADHSIISFTEEPIKSRLKSLKKVKDNILVKKDSGLVLEELRRDAIHYITHGLEDLQWSELKINIYDSDELYKLQYQRLVTILSDLESGIILGEAWTKDHAFALFSITAYQIRFFTFLDPLEIKKILIAFEYNQAGERMVDYDLFIKNNKISWSDIFNDNKRRDRKKLAFKYREKLLKDLSKEAVERYFALEAEINAESQ